MIATSAIRRTAAISTLNLSQKMRVSSAASREGGGAVGIIRSSILRPAGFAPRERRLMPRENRHSSPDFFLPLKFSGMNVFWNFFGPLLGLGARPEELTFVQISLRGIIVFLATLIMVRLGHKRSLARKTAFDAVLIVILASVLSRAVNGSAACFATLGGSFVIVMLHRLLAWCASDSHRFGILIKGRPEVIIEDGDFVLSTMHRNHISTHDVEEDMRLSLRTDDVSKVKKGRVERSGDVSFICK